VGVFLLFWPLLTFCLLSGPGIRSMPYNACESTALFTPIVVTLKQHNEYLRPRIRVASSTEMKSTSKDPARPSSFHHAIITRSISGSPTRPLVWYTTASQDIGRRGVLGSTAELVRSRSLGTASPMHVRVFDGLFWALAHPCTGFCSRLCLKGQPSSDLRGVAERGVLRFCLKDMHEDRVPESWVLCRVISGFGRRVMCSQ